MTVGLLSHKSSGYKLNFTGFDWINPYFYSGLPNPEEALQPPVFSISVARLFD
jgi:hypothetical protein